MWRSRWYDIGGYIGCIVKFSDGTRKTILQHREKLEKKLGRKLKSDEIVHHKDRHKRNNVVRNLELTNVADHNREHNEQPFLTLVCLWCDRTFERHGPTERGNRSKGKRGPFCGKSCAGKCSAKLRGKFGDVSRHHGTEYGYAYYRCRCRRCRKAHRLNRRRQRSRHGRVRK